MSIKIYENFLEKNSFNTLFNEMCNENFPWYFNDKITSNFKKNDLENFQFVHVFYKQFSINSSYFHILDDLIKKINPASILKIKANLNPYTSKKYTSDFHIDQNFVSAKTAVFYLNSNNGETIFKNDTSILSKENTLVTFDSNILHAGTSCTDQKFKCLININYIERNF